MVCDWSGTWGLLVQSRGSTYLSGPISRLFSLGLTLPPPLTNACVPSHLTLGTSHLVLEVGGRGREWGWGARGGVGLGRKWVVKLQPHFPS